MKLGIAFRGEVLSSDLVTCSTIFVARVHVEF